MNKNKNNDLFITYEKFEFYRINSIDFTRKRLKFVQKLMVLNLLYVFSVMIFAEEYEHSINM